MALATMNNAQFQSIQDSYQLHCEISSLRPQFPLDLCKLSSDFLRNTHNLKKSSSCFGRLLSKCLKHEENYANFCVLLRKSELYKTQFPLTYLLISNTIDIQIKTMVSIFVLNTGDILFSSPFRQFFVEKMTQQYLKHIILCIFFSTKNWNKM